MRSATAVAAFIAVVLFGDHGLLGTARGATSGWPTYGFDYNNSRHVTLTQINERNVTALEPAWRHRTSLHGRMESSPIVVGDTMYITTGVEDGVVALDAATGAQRWHYTPVLDFNDSCCGLVNRGVAVDGGRVFYATLDAHLIALDARTGHELWRRAIGDPHSGLSETMAPLTWHGMVFIGSSGGELGVRGSFSAYDARRGNLLWRWWTVSRGWEGTYVTSVHGVSLHRHIQQEKRDAASFRNGWQHGGGPIWMTPALDEQRSTIYLSTGNPSPVFRSELRPGDNLYTDSIVALNARTGKLKWFYQETPHDPGDHDAASPPVLFEVTDPSGRVVPAVGEAGKTGWFYILERSTGRFIRVTQSFVPQHDVYTRVRTAGDVIRPGTLGGAIAPVSFDPELHLAFVEAIDLPQRIDPASSSAELGGGNYIAGTITSFDAGNNFVCAIDVDTGRIAWQKQLTSGHNWMLGGTLSAGNILFAPDPNGTLYALDARNGGVLWQYQIGDHSDDILATFGDKVHDFFASLKRSVLRQSKYPTANMNAPPVRYELNGREYIAIAADVAPGKRSGGGAVFVFSLPQASQP